MLAAMLDPRYARRLTSLPPVDGVSYVEIGKRAVENLKRWIKDMQPPATVQARRERSEWSADDDDDDDDSNYNNVINNTDAIAACLVAYMRETATPEHAKQYPMPATSEDVDKTATAETLRRCFVDNKNWAPLLPLVRAIFSMPASSAEAERAFSASGRVCSPLRSRLSALNVERLTVLHHYVRKNDIVGFCDRLLDHFTN